MFNFSWETLYDVGSIEKPEGDDIKAEQINGIGNYLETHAIPEIYRYTGTLLSSGWTGSGPYAQSITVTGILASDNPDYDLVCSGTYATDTARVTAWNNVYRMVTAANVCTFYATAAPTVDLPFAVQGVR